MKVLFVDQFSTTEGKNAFYLAKKINEQQNQFKIDLYFRVDDRKDYHADGQTKIIFAFGDAYHGTFFHKIHEYLKSIHKLEKFIKANKYDIVILQWYSIPWLEYSFVKRIKKCSKIINLVHDVIPFNNKIGMISSLRKIYKKSDLIFVHSSTAKDEFCRIYSNDVPIHLVSGAFCDKTYYPKMPKAESMNRLSINPNRLTVLYYGSVRESKGLDVLMEAVIKAARIEPCIYLVGGGAFQGVSEDRRKYYEETANLLKKEGFGSVKFEFIKDELEPYYFSAADIICLPYKSGWQSGVAQLGLCYSLPILASNINEMKEVVTNDYNGILFKNGDVDDLCEKLIFLARNRKILKKYSSNSSSLYDSKYTLDRKAADFVDGLNALTAKD